MARGWKFSASDGEKIYLYRWKPETDSVKAAVQICHGMAEHAERYDSLAEKLTELGYVVFAADQRGHGKTVDPEDGDALGFFAEQDGWNRIVEDQHEIADKIETEYPGVPVFLLGHSMGSFVARTLMFMYPEYYSGVVLSGTGGKLGLLGSLGLWMAKRGIKKYGPRKPNQKMNDMTFGSYNDAFKPARTAFDWLSRDEEQVDAYVADPLCGFVCSSALYRDLLEGLKRVNKAENIQLIPKNLPTLLVSGSKDPVGKNGKGVEEVYTALQQHGLTDLKIKLFDDARHEILNETNREEVFAFIIEWLEEHVKQAAD